MKGYFSVVVLNHALLTISLLLNELQNSVIVFVELSQRLVLSLVEVLHDELQTTSLCL